MTTAHVPLTLLLLLPTAAQNPFSADGVNLMGHVDADDFSPPQTWGRKCWGYVSPAGREYAVLGTWRGTGFVEVTDPGRPRILDVVPGPVSGWRVTNVFADHAFVVSEDGPGIQVIDLSQIDAGVVTLVNTVTAGGPPDSHNVAIDATSGFLYRLGFHDGPGIRMYDLADPANPLFVGQWDDDEVHNAQVVTYTAGPFAGREFAFACTTTGVDSLSVVEVTDKQNPVRVAEVTYPNNALSHQVWLSEDRQWAFLNDEADEPMQGLPSTTYVFDVADVENPVYVTSFTNGNTATTHDNFVAGGLLYCANFTSGLRVFDVSDPLAAYEVAWYDTYPDSDLPVFAGLSSTFPFFPSGTILGSGKAGLFVWTIGDPVLAFSYPNGLPAQVDPAGDTIAVRIAEAAPGGLEPGSATLVIDADSGPQFVPLVGVGGNDYEATLPSLPCGALVRYFVAARSTDGTTWTDPPASTTRPERHLTTAALFRTVLFEDDFEADLGWTTTAPPPGKGFWERVDPNGTPHAPEDDHTPGAGVTCWVTENGPPGAGPFQHIVSGGPYVLTSPALDLSGASDPWFGYARWFSNNGNPQHDDVFTVEITADGSTWVPVEVVGPTPPGTTGGWVPQRFRLRDFVPPTAAVQLRFLATSFPPASTVEAAIDDFEVFDPVCTAAAVHCTAKVSAIGCTPAIGFSGLPSASSSAPFAITASDVPNQRSGLFVYGLSGPSAQPFLGGTLCQNPPLRRTPIQFSGGNPPPADCSGTLAFDFNAWFQAGNEPFATVGSVVDGQFWFRDPPASFQVGLSDAIEFTILP